MMASAPGGVLTAGSHANRHDRTEKTIDSAPNGAPGSAAANCFQAFNRKEDATPYRKPQKLVEVLTNLFHNHEPKLTPEQARAELEKMRDPQDGGRMFCWSKRGTFMPKGTTKAQKKAYGDWQGCVVCGKKPCECNGMLLPVESIKAFFGSLAKSRKKIGKENMQKK